MNAPPAIRIVFWIWFLAAIAIGRLEWLARLPLPAVQAALLALTALLILGYRWVTPFRSWIDSLSLRFIVLLHVSRLVGIYFLVLYRRGELPYAFAVPGGIGDIVVAALALLVVLIPLAETTRLRAIYIWNVVGFVDILLVVVTAARIGRSSPQEMVALTHLPLSLLPTFLVPLIMASHLLVFTRVSRAQP